MGPAPWIQFRPACPEPAVNGRRRDLQQLWSRAGINVRLFETPQAPDQIRQRRREQPPARVPWTAQQNRSASITGSP